MKDHKSCLLFALFVCSTAFLSGCRDSINQPSELVTPAFPTESGETTLGNVVGGDKAHGLTLFREYCARCHGETGTGDGPIYAGNPGMLPDFSSVEFNREPKYIADIVQNGTNTGMPAFANRLTPDQIRDIVAAVQAFKRNETN